MTAFSIKSTISDLQLVLLDVQGDYFTARFESSHLNATLGVYNYRYSPNAESLADFMQWIGEQDGPWEGSKEWESLEGEFKMSADCSPLGVVTFQVRLRYFDGAENWEAQTDLVSELGLLPGLAKSARAFFGASKL